MMVRSAPKPLDPRSDPLDRAEATHALRRVGFAPSHREVDHAMQQGIGAIIDHNLAAGDDSPRHDELDAIGERLARRQDIASLRAWWLLRMTHTTRPLRARMAVFWHNVFATSNAKVNSSQLMFKQLRVFERLAFANFGELLLAMARDPAMIVWLDGNENINGRPNENFARELFELFALGVGNYSERDIQEAARAFTGWHQKRGRFHYAQGLHDNGVKTVFGQSGNLDGNDIIDLTTAHDACAVFLADALLREFLCPTPPKPLIAALADHLRRNNLNVGSALRTLFTSHAMFDQRWRRSRIKSPVEFVIGIARSLELHAKGPQLANTTSEMGQRLFEPPSVKGWDGHRAWLNTATMLVRLNTVQRATEADMLAAGTLADAHNLANRDDAIRFCADLTLDGAIPASIRAPLRSAPDDPADALRAALALMMTCPEYHMA